MCSRSGRKCQGYLTPPDGRTREVRDARHARTTGRTFSLVPMSKEAAMAGGLVVMVDASQVGLSNKERQYLSLFRSHTAAHCTGYSFDPFWQLLVHQASECYPVVRHAVIAISALHREFADPIAGQDDIFALRQCNKAIGHLRKGIIEDDLSDPSHTEKVLVACVVLITVALFQGDVEAVRCHLRSGTKLLWEWRKNNAKHSIVAPILLNTFVQLHLHWASATWMNDYKGSDWPFLLELIDDNIQDIMEYPDEQTRQTLLLPVQAWLVLFSDPTRFNTKTFDSAPPQGFMWDTVSDKFHRYKNGYQNCVVLHKNRVSTNAPNQERAMLLLKINNEILHITLTSLHFTGSEMEWDTLLPHFEGAVDATEKLLTDFSGMLDPYFSAKEGWIPTLFMTGIACRDWSIRQRVLRIFETYNRREGIYSTSEALVVLPRIYEIEHAGIAPGEIVPEHNRVSMGHVEETPNHSNYKMKSYHLLYRDVNREWHREELLCGDTAVRHALKGRFEVATLVCNPARGFDD